MRANLIRIILQQVRGDINYVTNEFATSKPVAEVEAAIIEQFRSGSPAFTIEGPDSPAPGIFHLDAVLEFDGGARRCRLVAGQTRNGETLIVFRVVEFKGETVLGQALKSLITANPAKYTGIDPFSPLVDEKSKNQVDAGLKMVRERIQKAIAP